jgi:hypothetical protein
VCFFVLCLPCFQSWAVSNELSHAWCLVTLRSSVVVCFGDICLFSLSSLFSLEDLKMKKKTIVCIYGSSVALGNGHQFSWAKLLEEKLRSEDRAVVNLSQSGSDTRTAIARFQLVKNLNVRLLIAFSFSFLFSLFGCYLQVLVFVFLSSLSCFISHALFSLTLLFYRCLSQMKSWM